MKLAVVACCVASLGTVLGLAHSDFDAFCAKFQKDYSTNPGEYATRLQLFLKQKALVDAHNAKAEVSLKSLPLGSSPYRKGLNQFSDMTAKEYKRFFGLKKTALGMRGTALPLQNGKPFLQSPLPSSSLPISWDWSKKGAVTKARNQGNCGSCW